jgi:hypothetical protein
MILSKNMKKDHSAELEPQSGTFCFSLGLFQGFETKGKKRFSQNFSKKTRFLKKMAKKC